MKFRIDPLTMYKGLGAELREILKEKEFTINGLGVVEVPAGLTAAEKTAIKAAVLPKLKTPPVEVTAL